VSDGALHEILDINLAFMSLAQQMIRANQAEAMRQLGIGTDVADILANLSLTQLTKLANTHVLVCRFRFDEAALLSAPAPPVARTESAAGLADHPQTVERDRHADSECKNNPCLDRAEKLSHAEVDPC
jgi:flagellar transcriptional activator FlhD